LSFQLALLGLEALYFVSSNQSMKPREQKLISLKRVRNKFLRAAKRDLPAIDRLDEPKSFPIKPQKGKKYLMGDRIVIND
jgi:hypothetical protein